MSGGKGGKSSRSDKELARISSEYWNLASPYLKDVFSEYGELAGLRPQYRLKPEAWSLWSALGGQGDKVDIDEFRGRLKQALAAGPGVGYSPGDEGYIQQLLSAPIEDIADEIPSGAQERILNRYRAALEPGYAEAIRQIEDRVPRGGQLPYLVSELYSERAKDLAALPVDLQQQALSMLANLASGGAGQAIGGLGAAGGLQTSRRGQNLGLWGAGASAAGDLLGELVRKWPAGKWPF